MNAGCSWNYPTTGCSGTPSQNPSQFSGAVGTCTGTISNSNACSGSPSTADACSGTPTGGSCSGTPSSSVGVGFTSTSTTQALDIFGNTNIVGPSGSGSVTLRLGDAGLEFNGTNLVLKKPSGGVVQYNDGSTLEEVASQGFVNAQLGKALTGDSDTLTTLLSNLSTLISGNPTQAISASVCGFYSNMTWNGTRCVDNRTSACPAGEAVKGFNNGSIVCMPVMGYSPTASLCADREFVVGFNQDGSAKCKSYRDINKCQQCGVGETCKDRTATSYICEYTVTGTGDYCNSGNGCDAVNGLTCSYQIGAEDCTGCCAGYWNKTVCKNDITGKEVLMEKWLSTDYDRTKLCSNKAGLNPAYERYNWSITGYKGPFNY